MLMLLNGRVDVVKRLLMLLNNHIMLLNKVNVIK